MSDPNRPVEIQLAVLDSKLDGIKSTLDVRLNHIESMVAKNATDIAAVDRHSEAGIRQQGEAFAALVKEMATKADLATNAEKSDERYGLINARIDAKADKLTQTVVMGFIALILTAFGGKIVADYIHDRSEPRPYVQQHVAAPPAMTSTVTVQPKAD